MTDDIELSCPCLSGQPYPDCCQPLHDDAEKALTAEQLMRSRYTAFCAGHIPYIIQTTHPSKRKFGDGRRLASMIKRTKWIGLKIINHTEQGDSATVEFMAYYLDNQLLGQQHELSQFIKQKNQWFYVDGQVLPAIKLSRNDRCFCNSGKKFKHCHGPLIAQLEQAQ